MTATAALGGLTGVAGRSWRGEVDPRGAIAAPGGSLGWYVAAEDRWHTAADETSIRQHRLAGTAVFETRLRVPGGDVVQRIWSVADAGGITLVEFTNESSRAVAVALDRSDLLTARPAPTVPVEGIDLPSGAMVLPLAHHAAVSVGLAHDGWRSGRLPERLPAADDVANGWLAATAVASRLDLPDKALVDAVVAQRCELLLGGPVAAAPATDVATGTAAAVDTDAVAAALAIVELVRMGDPPGPWVPELTAALEAVARRGGWDVDAALERAAIVLAAAGEDRARRDLDRLGLRRERRSGRRNPPDPADIYGQNEGERGVGRPGGVRLVAWAERRLATGPELLPHGIPDDWLGRDFAVFGVPTGPVSTVSFAVRWHGEHPAVLWEQHGPTVALRARSIDPAWTSVDRSGEAMWQIGDRLRGSA